MKRFPITKKAFVEYIRSHPRTKYNSHTDTCPVARAIRSIAPAKIKQRTDEYGGRRRDHYVRVYRSHATIGMKHYTLPLWARDFIRAFDGRGNRDALAVLNDLRYY